MKKVSMVSHLHRATRAFAWLALGASLLGGCVTGDVKLLDSVEPGEPPLPDAGAPDAGPPPPECEIGSFRCLTSVLQQCEESVGWVSRQRCASPALCQAGEGETARCLDPFCAAGTVCEGAVLRECNDELTDYEDVSTCVSALHCDGMLGACRDASCEDGTVSCNGARLQRCNVSEDRFDDLATCQTAELCGDLLAATCGDDPTGCDVPADVACDEPACEVGELRCEGTRLELCNPGRNGWTLLDECVSNGMCELTRGGNLAATECLTPRCESGQTACTPEGALVECNDEQTDFTRVIQQCRSAAFCTPGLRTCSTDPCTAGQQICNGSVLQECRESADGSDIRFVNVEQCSTASLCEGSRAAAFTPPRCIPPTCLPGQFSCAGRQLQVCNAGQTAFVNQPGGLCATDALCQIGIGLGTCPAPCSGFECRGSGELLFGCNAGLTGLELKENCGTAAQCDSQAGACTDPCIVGALRCNGAALEECRDRTLGWQRLQTCISAGLCQQSVADDLRVCTPARCQLGDHQCLGQQLQRCAADRTGFELATTCAAGQICDAANQQCDVCVAGSLDCEGDVFVRCGLNGQEEFRATCGAGLCSSVGANVGCLQCPVAGGFRCDNQGSLFQCSDNQQQENQLSICREPELCDAGAGLCLACDPSGSSRCDGANILLCTDTNLEISGGTCASAELCVPAATPGTVECQDDQCPQEFQCTAGGEVLVCNAGRTGYVSQSPPRTCVTPALCSVGDPDGCLDPVCDVGDTQCDGTNEVVEVCNSDQNAFQTSELCSARGAGFACVELDATTAACQCESGTYRCTTDGLEQCAGDGSDFVAVAGDLDCDGTERVSCSGLTVVRDDCLRAELCEASPGASCLDCTLDVDCGGATPNCDVAGGNVCVECVDDGDCGGATPVCNGSNACVECEGAADCSDGDLCTTDACNAGVCANAAVTCTDDGATCNGTEACDPGTGLCASSGNPCTGGTPQCIEATDECVECVGDGDCGAPTPICDVPGGNVCVECTEDADCGAQICVDQACVPGPVGDAGAP